jgi:beta-aspartyl-peptidase (threonine type)
LNADTGSSLCLDGRTIQMDAALMIDTGAFAGATVIERVRISVEAGARVLRSPQVLLAGDGATPFPRTTGTMGSPFS